MINVLSLFDGMSCGQIALARAGVGVGKYYASEIDKHAITVTQANYPNTAQFGDITKWRDWDIDWGSIDLVMGGPLAKVLVLQVNNLHSTTPEVRCSSRLLTF